MQNCMPNQFVECHLNGNEADEEEKEEEKKEASREAGGLERMGVAVV